MSAGESQAFQFRQPQPAVAWTEAWLGLPNYDSGFQGNPEARDGMFDDTESLSSTDGQTQLPSSPAPLAGARVRNVHIRKLPQTAIHDSSPPLAHKKTSVALENEGDETTRRRRRSPTQIRQGVDEARPARCACDSERTTRTLRLSRRANRRSQFHEGLIECGTGAECARCRRGRTTVAPPRRPLHELFRQMPKSRLGGPCSRIAAEAEDARQHADDVAVENGNRLVPGHAADRAGRVAADAGQRQHLLKLFRESPTVIGDHPLRGVVRVSGAPIITQALP
jgi:hypothetical protein